MTAISFQDGDNFIRNVATIMDGGGLARSRPQLLLSKGAVGGLPVSIDEIMDHLHVDDPDEERATVEGMAHAACAFIEKRTGYVLLPTEYSITMSGFWTAGLEVLRGPLRADPALEYQTARGVWEAVPDSDLWASPNDRQFTVRTIAGFNAPQVWQPEDCVRLKFTCGFDAEDESGGVMPIEKGLRMILMLITGHYYQNREMLGAADAKYGLEAVELGATSLLGAYRQFW